MPRDTLYPGGQDIARLVQAESLSGLASFPGQLAGIMRQARESSRRELEGERREEQRQFLRDAQLRREELAAQKRMIEAMGGGAAPAGGGGGVGATAAGGMVGAPGYATPGRSESEYLGDVLGPSFYQAKLEGIEGPGALPSDEGVYDRLRARQEEMAGYVPPRRPVVPMLTEPDVARNEFLRNLASRQEGVERAAADPRLSQGADRFAAELAGIREGAVGGDEANLIRSLIEGGLVPEDLLSRPHEDATRIVANVLAGETEQTLAAKAAFGPEAYRDIPLEDFRRASREAGRRASEDREEAVAASITAATRGTLDFIESDPATADLAPAARSHLARLLAIGDPSGMALLEERGVNMRNLRTVQASIANSQRTNWIAQQKINNANRQETARVEAVEVHFVKKQNEKDSKAFNAEIGKREAAIDAIRKNIEESERALNEDERRALAEAEALGIQGIPEEDVHSILADKFGLNEASAANVVGVANNLDPLRMELVLAENEVDGLRRDIPVALGRSDGPLTTEFAVNLVKRRVANLKNQVEPLAKGIGATEGGLSALLAQEATTLRQAAREDARAAAAELKRQWNSGNVPSHEDILELIDLRVDSGVYTDAQAREARLLARSTYGRKVVGKPLERDELNTLIKVLLPGAVGPGGAGWVEAEHNGESVWYNASMPAGERIKPR